MLYSIVADKESRTVTIYLSHPMTPQWGYPVLTFPVENVRSFIQGLIEAMVTLEVRQEETLPICIKEFIETLPL